MEDVDRRFIARRTSRSRSSSRNAKSSVESFSGGSGVGFVDSGIAESADEEAVDTLLVRDGMVEATESVVSVEDNLLKPCDEEVDGIDGRSMLCIPRPAPEAVGAGNLEKVPAVDGGVFGGTTGELVRRAALEVGIETGANFPGVGSCETPSGRVFARRNRVGTLVDEDDLAKVSGGAGDGL